MFSTIRTLLKNYQSLQNYYVPGQDGDLLSRYVIWFLYEFLFIDFPH